MADAHVVVGGCHVTSRSKLQRSTEARLPANEQLPHIPQKKVSDYLNIKVISVFGSSKANKQIILTRFVSSHFRSYHDKGFT